MAVTNYMTVNGQIRSEHRSGEAKSRDYVHDALGNVVAVFQDDWPVAMASYDPSGEFLTSWNMSGYKFTWNGSHGYRQTGLEWSSTYVRARHYSFMDGAWTTRDPLWPREMPYGYVEGMVMSASDPSGEAIRFVGCDESIQDKINKLCARLKEASKSQVTEINTCIERTTRASGYKAGCQPFNDDRLKCYQNFCNSGYVECQPTNGKDYNGICPAALGKEPSDSQTEPWGGIIIKYPPDASNFSSGSGEPQANRQGRLTFLHEVGHACGVEHGNKRDLDCQCNDIYACCMFEVLMGRSGNSCVDSMKRYIGRGNTCYDPTR
jgi:RHS repeat-associated protein